MEHTHGHHHAHTHGVPDPSLAATESGMRATVISFLILACTAAFQIHVASLSGSVALLADTIHNIADACTAIPLWIAFALGRRKPSMRFTYGWGRFEDLAGLIILAIIIASAVSVAYTSIDRIVHPIPITNISAVIIAGVVGFAGNTAVAWYRTRVGKKIGSAALIADGHHARIDGFASLAVIAGAAGVLVGFPLADTLIGIGIVFVLIKIMYDAGKTVLARLLDAIDPAIIADITRIAQRDEACLRILGARARWTGHELRADLRIVVDENLPMHDVSRIAHRISHAIHAELPSAAHISVYVCPSEYTHP